MPNEANQETPDAKPVAAAAEGQAASAATGRGARRSKAIATWGLTFLLSAATVTLIAIAANKRPPPLLKSPRVLANVEVMHVTPQEHRESLVLPARIEADRHADISSELSGRLQEWRVDEGARVTAGQVVALLNTDELRAQLGVLEAQRDSARKAADVSLRQVEAAQVALKKAEKDAAALTLELESAQADLVFAQKDHARIQSLTAESIAAQVDLDATTNRLTQAELEVAKSKDAIERGVVSVEASRIDRSQAEASQALAQARVKEAESNIDSVRVALGKTELRAPFDGRLEEYLVEVGEVVSHGTPVARVYDLEYVRAAIDVADRYVAFLDATNPAVADYIAAAMPGAKQDIRASVIIPGPPKLTGGAHAGIELQADVYRIAQSADALSNTFRVELRVRNPSEALKHGMIGRARIDYLSYPGAIVIPLAAVQVTDTGPRALVVEQRDGSSVASVRDIEPLSIDGRWLLVGQGLKSGDCLVVAGGKGVVDGEQVSVIVVDGGARTEMTAPQEPGSETDVISVPPDYEAGSSKTEKTE